MVLKQDLLNRFFLEFDLVVIHEYENTFTLDIHESSRPFAQLDDPRKRRVIGLQHGRTGLFQEGLEVLQDLLAAARSAGAPC